MTGRAGPLALVIAGALMPATVSATTLADALSQAYLHNPTLNAQRSGLRVLDEAYAQARASLGMTVTVTAEEDSQAARVDQPGSIFSLPSTLRAHGRTDAETASVVQPLYEGGQGAAAVAAARFDVLSGREQLRGVEIQVLQQTITAYDDVVRDQAVLTIAETTLEQLGQELHEAEARFKEHEITITDKAQAQARLAASRASLALARARLDASRASYVAVVGEAPDHLAPPSDLEALPETADQAFDLAERLNTGLNAALLTEQSSRNRIAQTRAENSATVALRMDLVHSPVEPYDERYYQQSFTARLVVSKPIYTSGMNSSRLREALERNNHDRVAAEGARRGAIEAVAQAWAQLTATSSEVVILDAQLHAEQLAYDSVRQELRAGLRTTIEVLNAEQELQNTKVQLVAAQHDRHIAEAAVLAAAGALDIKSIAPDVSLYRPELNFRKADSQAPPWTGVVEAIDSLRLPNTPPLRLFGIGGSKRPVLSPPIPIP